MTGNVVVRRPGSGTDLPAAVGINEAEGLSH